VFLHSGFRAAEPADVRVLMERMEADGVTIVERNDEAAYTAFKCLDPDGIPLVASPHPSWWRYRPWLRSWLQVIEATLTDDAASLIAPSGLRDRAGLTFRATPLSRQHRVHEPHYAYRDYYNVTRWCELNGVNRRHRSTVNKILSAVHCRRRRLAGGVAGEVDDGRDDPVVCLSCWAARRRGRVGGRSLR
jgi:hypothetical protein